MHLPSGSAFVSKTKFRICTGIQETHALLACHALFWSCDCLCKVKDRLTPPTHTLSRLAPINTDELTNHLPQVYTIWNRAPHTGKTYKGPIFIPFHRCSYRCQTDIRRESAAHCYTVLKSARQAKTFYE